MDEKDFDKLFSEKMKGGTTHDFSEEDWHPLSQRLDGWQRRRWRVLPLWWLGALSGLLLLSNFLWWLTWRESHAQISLLLQQGLQHKASQIVNTFDTIYHTSVVYQYDTIYKTVVLQTYRNEVLAANTAPAKNSMVSGQAIASSGTSVNSNTQNLNTSDIKTPPSGSSTSGTTSTTAGDEAIAAKTGSDADKAHAEEGLSTAEMAQMQTSVTALDPIPLLHPKELVRRTHPPIPLPPLADWETVRPKEKKPFPLIPKTFHAGVGGGWTLPSANVIANKKGNSVALKGEIGFSDKLFLLLEGTYSSLSFQGYVYDESIGLPTPNPPGDDYAFKYFETHHNPKPMAQLTTAMRYRFIGDKKLSPFFGAGFAAQWHPEYRLEYEYTHLPSGTEYSESFEVEESYKPLSFLHFEFGLSYQIAKRWDIQTSGFYDVEASRSQVGIPQFYGLKAFLMYEF